MKERDTLDFVIGEEKRIDDLLSQAEIMPLLRSAIEAGASWAAVACTGNGPIWQAGERTDAAAFSEPIHLEGEPVADVRISGPESSAVLLRGLLRLLGGTVRMLLQNSLKRVLTTEAHTKVVNQSYDELVETNRRLRASEAQSRELAAHLDRKVKDRTKELEKAHVQLLQQEKMASVGRLAAGVAHEINNPLGFITSNVNTLNRYLDAFRTVAEYYREAAGQRLRPEDIAEAGAVKWRDLKLDRITADLSELRVQTSEGLARVKTIVADLKGFSHIDDRQETLADLNEEIEKTLSVLSHEKPADAEVDRSYGALPAVLCVPALLCQAFLNIILNAFQARQEGLKLTITTAREHGDAVIRFSDNGPGIPEELQERIFEPFFTTKEIGSGAGMGLSVAYEAVVSHGGSISVESRSGEGTTFLVRLPLGRA